MTSRLITTFLMYRVQGLNYTEIGQKLNRCPRAVGRDVEFGENMFLYKHAVFMRMYHDQLKDYINTFYELLHAARDSEKDY